MAENQNNSVSQRHGMKGFGKHEREGGDWSVGEKGGEGRKEA